MTTTIQLRRGTAAQWTASNPVLAAGEPAFESDTGKFKIGNGSSAWTALAYAGGSNEFDTSIIFEGSSVDAFETTLTVTDPTADRTITLPDATTTVVGTDTTQTLTNKTIALGSNTVSGTLAQFNTAVTDADLASLNGTETLTNKTLSSATFTGTLTAGGSAGTNGYFLQTTGSGIQWAQAATAYDDDDNVLANQIFG